MTLSGGENTEWREGSEMQRYAVEQFDGSTFQVMDLMENREICVCSDYDDWEDAKERVEKIVALLNADE